MRGKLSLKRRIAAGIVVACMLVSFGCRKEEEEERIEITLFHGYGGTLESYEIMQEIYDEFTARNPDIDLKCVEYMNNQIAVEKANDMLAVGEMPDIVSTNSASYYVENAVKSECALDLKPYIEADPKWKSQIHPSVFKTWETEDGSLYTIPDALELAGYWYNTEYLEEAEERDGGDEAISGTW